MRKWLVNLTGLLTISSSALPLTGCTFNFYINRVKEKVATNLAVQTSSVIKSLIASKELSADTKPTINDALVVTGDSTINNQSRNKRIENWDDFRNSWGYNNEIKTRGFNGDDFIVPEGQGSLTSQVNSLRSTNATLGYLTYVKALNVIDNNTLYGVLIADKAIGKPIIKSFLTELKNQTIPEPFGSLINNLLNDYKGNVLTPITTLLNELVDGWTVPSDFKGYMDSWKDAAGIPYSQWTTDNDWTLDPQYYESWTDNDKTLYRGGTYINYLFKKMGEDNPDKIPTSKYLGKVLDAAVIGAINIGTGEIDMEKLLAAFQPYFDLLLSNPKYILMLATGLIPLIKQLLFNANDLTHGIKKLTLGDNYPSDKPNDSYNLKEVFLELKNTLQDKEKTKELIRNLLESPFLYDLNVMLLLASGPLPVALDKLEDNTLFPFSKEDSLVVPLADLLTGPDVGNIFNDIYKVIEKLNDQFQGTDGINLNLEGLKDFLLNDNTGLLVLLEEVATTLADIIKPEDLYADDDDDITDEDLGKLYESIGGQLPGEDGSAPSTFRENSVIDVLKNAIADKDSDLSVLLTVITRDDEYQGVANIITEQNDAWIKENYTDYFQPTYPRTSVANIKYKVSENSIEKTTTISYDFYYQVNGVKYHFLIKGLAVDKKDEFLGTHDFKFTEISKL